MDAALACYLRDGFVRYDCALAHARICSTLDFRREHGLDERSEDLAEVIERHPIRSSWPAGYPRLFTSEGCPIVFTRLAAIDVPKIASFPKADFVHFVALWYERSLQLSAESTRAFGAPCTGTCDVYDCAEVRWSKLLCDLRAYRATVATLFDLAAHTPDGVWKCYVINAPWSATVAWNRIVRPFLSERAQGKVVVSSGVPAELEQALGGEEGVRTMIASVSLGPINR